MKFSIINKHTNLVIYLAIVFTLFFENWAKILYSVCKMLAHSIRHLQRRLLQNLSVSVPSPFQLSQRRPASNFPAPGKHSIFQFIKFEMTLMKFDDLKVKNCTDHVVMWIVDNYCLTFCIQPSVIFGARILGLRTKGLMHKSTKGIFLLLDLEFLLVLLKNTKISYFELVRDFLAGLG